MIYTSKTPYIPLEQKPDFCYPGIINTDTNRRGVLYDLDSLAAFLEVNINEKYKEMYSPELQKRALPEGNANIGFLVDRLKDPENLGRILKLGYNKAKFHWVSEFKNLDDASDFIAENMEKNRLSDHDVAIGMNFRWDKIRGTKNGHYTLIAAYDNKSKIITICDTSFTNQGFCTIHLEPIIEGMQARYEEDDGKPRERGFLELDGPSKLIRIPGIITPEELYKTAKPYAPHAFKLVEVTPKDRGSINP
jgi:hypothetical protein